MFKDNKKLVTETIFIKEALRENLSLNEFLLLLYFDNSFDLVFDIATIAKTLNMSEDAIIDAYSKLMSKKIIKVKAEKDGFGKIIEKVNLDEFYNEIKKDNKVKEKEDSKEDIFSKFEKAFGRTLSGIDCEIINAWIDKGFSKDLIEAALKEAVYNGVFSLRYVDKVLYEWNRKGYKNAADISKKMMDAEEKESPLFETSILNFDWLDEK